MYRKLRKMYGTREAGCLGNRPGPPRAQAKAEGQRPGCSLQRSFCKGDKLSLTPCVKESEFPRQPLVSVSRVVTSEKRDPERGAATETQMVSRHSQTVAV